MDDMYDSVKKPEVLAANFMGVPYTRMQECLLSIQNYLKRPGSILIHRLQTGMNSGSP